MNADYVKQWLLKASNDLKTSRHELELPADEVVTDAVCYHSQQGAEKLLKAYLIYKNEDFGRTHNLEYLRQLCSKYDPSFLKCELGQLSEYAVAVRYPDNLCDPDLSEAKEAYKLALTIEAFVLDKLGIC